MTFNKSKIKYAATISVLIASMLMLSMTGAHNAFAVQKTIDANSKLSKENGAAWQKHKASIQPLTTYSTGASCTHLATWSFPCVGWNSAPFANDFYYFTPYTTPPTHHTCGTTDCVDTDIELKNVTPITYSGNSYSFVSANYVFCTSPSVCSSPTYWQAPYNDIAININNIPANVPIQHEIDYLYRASGQPDLHILVTDYLQYGYN